MAQRHQHTARIATAFVRRAKELEDGKVRCLGCSAVVALTPNRRLPTHRDPAGEPCAYTASYADPVTLEEIPPVVIPPEPRPPRRTTINQRATAPKTDEVEQDARLAAANNECVDCARWLPGERKLCAKCSRRRNEEKGR